MLQRKTRDPGSGNFTSSFSSMLAKQAWRLISKPYSLLSHVFKAKYFPSCSFMEFLHGGYVECKPKFCVEEHLEVGGFTKGRLEMENRYWGSSSVWKDPWLAVNRNP